MPAIDALPTTPVEVRPGGQVPATSENFAEADPHASDAFIAALLAQNTPQPTITEVPQAGTAALGTTTGGQELPTLRPTVAAQPGLRRAATTQSTGSTLPPTVAPAAGTEGVEENFATAFATLQDKVTGAATSEQSPTAETDTAASVSALMLFSDGANATNGVDNPARVDTGLDAMAAVHGARGQEPVTTSPAYAAKPAPLPIDQPALFAERLNQHISVMLGEGVQSAQIAVSPADLGPVEVRVTMVGDEAKIQMVASHATTREALQDALPRLRASFAEAGLSLAQAGVFAQMPERQSAQPALDGRPAQGETDFDQAPLASLAPARTLRIGLIDAFV